LKVSISIYKKLSHTIMFMYFRQNLHLRSKQVIMKASILAFFALLLTASFSPDQIEGRWAFAYHDGDNAVYARTSATEKGGWLDFAEKGELTVRQNAGWCGTPPISYRTYDGGSYKLTKKGKLTMMHKFWGGIDTTHYQLAEVTDDTLRMKFLSRGTE